MKFKIIFSFIIVIFSVLSLYYYTNSSRAVNTASKFVSGISLEHYTFRGVAVKKSDTLSSRLSKNDILFQKDPKMAAVNYESMLKEDPGNVGIHLRLGLLYLKMKNISAAKEHLHFVHGNQDSGLQPDSAWFLALLNILENNNSEAEQLLLECIEKKCSYKKEASKLAELL